MTGFACRKATVSTVLEGFASLSASGFIVSLAGMLPELFVGLDASSWKRTLANHEDFSGNASKRPQHYQKKSSWCPAKSSAPLLQHLLLPFSETRNLAQPAADLKIQPTIRLTNSSISLLLGLIADYTDKKQPRQSRKASGYFLP